MAQLAINYFHTVPECHRRLHFSIFVPPALFKSATDYAGPMHQRRKNFQECENGPLER